jgi:electron-transferring-flavoprotein dehydrogenase
MERDLLEVDIVCVGAGIASLSTALRLLKKAQAENDETPPTVLILEKGAQIGSHVLSGAVIDPGPFKELLTEEEFATLPFSATVNHERFCYLSGNRTLPLPMTPPPMKAQGYPLASLGNLTHRLAELCEAAGAEVYPEMPVADFIEKDGRIIGVRLGDKGIDKDGNPKPNFEPGADVHAQAVVLGEGGYGILTHKLFEKRQLTAEANEQAYALGIKEVYEVPPMPERVGHIMHTFGYPMAYDMYGGGFVYAMDETHVALGLVIALDYHRPEINVHEMFRAYKAHPEINRWITAGTPVSYGARILPEGGTFAIPQLVTDHVAIVGDSGGLLDAIRLKGAHLAVESGIAAGNALYDCWKAGDFSQEKLSRYPEQLRQMEGWKRMHTFRNARQWFEYGLLPGMAAVGAAFLTNGLLPPGRKTKKPDYPLHKTGTKPPLKLPTLQRRVEKEHQLDLMSDLYLSGTEHNEDQPCHLIITDPEKCRDCITLYNAPCTRFCPAQVYELPDGTEKITIQPSNCLHCKTCTIKCTRENIQWTLPEGGGGPRYKNM